MLSGCTTADLGACDAVVVMVVVEVVMVVVVVVAVKCWNVLAKRCCSVSCAWSVVGSRSDSG